MTKEEVVKLATELAKRMKAVQEIVDVFEKNRWDGGIEREDAYVVDVNLYENKLSVFCNNLHSLADDFTYRCRGSNPYPHERSVMIDGVKFYDIGDFSEEMKNND